jgi:hypothetical protein
MDRKDASAKPAAGSVPADREEFAAEWYEGVDLAPRLESLVPWDVSARALREQARLRSAAYRIPRGIHGGY